MFDMAILVNYNSTDRSVEIIRQQAPHMWKIALNTPEFLVHSDLRQALVDLELEQTNFSNSLASSS